tara:strand:- start:105 stop:350 length:246 start_codon:yes stop_codon:yes gene_type:complete
MNYNNLTYVIIESSEISSVDFSKVKNTSAETLRRTVDQSEAIVKYEGDQPSFLNGKSTYSHEEILSEVKKSKWIHEDPSGL